MRRIGAKNAMELFYLDWITNPTVLARQFLAGLSNGALLFLVGAGLSLIFGVSRIINFAHGAIYMLGAYFGWTVVGAASKSPLTFAAAVVFSAAATFVAGAVFEMLVLRRIYRSDAAFQLLVTFALVLVLGDAVRLIWGREENSGSLPAGLDGPLRILGVVMPSYRVFLIVVGALVCLALWALLYRTRLGVLIRAATVDREMLKALGVRTDRLFTLVFGLGCGLAGLAGGLSVPIVAVGPGLHSQVLIEAFAVVVIGGMGSFPGTLVGAFLLGQANAFGVLAAPSLAVVLPFLVMTLVLMFRPWGLFGKPE
ncbi:MAG TPA: branched-chain amino acid ABC transporter permease [Burkholderiales bacterium]